MVEFVVAGKTAHDMPYIEDERNMGVFLQNALFPGCNEAYARMAVEAAAKNPAFRIDLENCRYAQSYEGTQVLIEGDELGFAPLAKALSEASGNPVLLLYIYDGDFWGYDFCVGDEEDHFCTLPDYFGPLSQGEKQRLSGTPAALTGWFPAWDVGKLRRYLVHWSNLTDEQEDAACPNDQFPYGDCWQMTDFAAQLGFPWPFDQPQDAPPLKPAMPTLGEILKQGLPPVFDEEARESRSLLEDLPSALSPEYIRKLLEEEGVRDFAFAEQTPEAVVEAVLLHRRTVSLPDPDRLCQRLAVLAAFCTFWLRGGEAGFLYHATYEPLYGSYEKPTDVYVLRARAALTEFSKRHRALKDLERLAELDPANRELYQAEMKRWNVQDRTWVKQAEPRHQEFIRQFEEKKRQEAEKDARRLELILAKRRKKKP